MADNPELAELERQFVALREVAQRLARTPGISREAQTTRNQAMDRYNVAQVALETARREAAASKEEATKAVDTTVGDYLVTQIGELQAAIDALAEEGIGPDVKNQRLTRVAELKDKIGNYTALLGIGTERLNIELRRAELALLANLGPGK